MSHRKLFAAEMRQAPDPAAKNRVASLLLALDQIDGQTSPGAVARADCNEFADPAGTLTSD